MSRRPALLMWCQHSLGLGHLTRSLALAEALAERFRVVLLCGGSLPAGLRTPACVEVVPLPALGAEPDGGLASRDAGRTLEDAWAERARTLLSTYRRVRPTCVVVELFPFGRKKFARELEPLLGEARRDPRRPLLVSSVRDILVSRGERQRKHDDLACERANRLLDLVLVHGDPRFATLDESFRPSRPLAVPLRYTGFVEPAVGPAAEPPAREAGVVVSAGGGLVGAPLLEAALAAQPALHARLGLPMTIVAGPFLPQERFEGLRRAAAGREGLILLRSVPSLRPLLAGAAASVSQCGYNTTLDVLSASVPAVVVPFAAPGEDEQLRRAERLARLGLAQVLLQDELDGAALAGTVEAALRAPRRAAGLDTLGARRSAEILEAALARRTPALQEAASL